MSKRKTVDAHLVVRDKYNRRRIKDLASLSEAAWSYLIAALFERVYEHSAPLLCGLGPRIKGQHEYRIKAVTDKGQPVFDVLLSNKPSYVYGDTALRLIVEWPEDAVFVPHKHRGAARSVFKFMKESFAGLVHNGYVFDLEDRVFYNMDFLYKLNSNRIPVVLHKDYKSYETHMPSDLKKDKIRHEVMKYLSRTIKQQKSDPWGDRLEFYVPVSVDDMALLALDTGDFGIDEIPRVQLITPLAFLFSTESSRSSAPRIDRHRAAARFSDDYNELDIPGRTIMSFLMSAQMRYEKMA